MSILRHSSPVALYRQVAEDIEDSLIANASAGDRLPTESELMQRYDVSRITIRQALARLSARDLIIRKQGKGTFVKPRRIHQRLHQLTGFQDALVERNISFETRLLDFGKREASPRMRELFQSEEADFWFLMRQYLIDGRPLSVTEVSMPIELFRDLSRDVAEQHASFTLLREVAGVEIDRAEVTIRAERAEGNHAGLLAVSFGSPVLVVERLTHAENGKPCEHTILRVRADAYEFGLTIDGGLSLASSIRAIESYRAMSDG